MITFHVHIIFLIALSCSSASALSLFNNSLIPSHQLLHFTQPSHDIKPNTGFVISHNNELFSAFRAFNRYFQITAFETDPIPVQVYGEVNFSFNSTHFSGKLHGDRLSSVYGYLNDGVFSCIITTAEDVFHIEPITDFNSTTAIIYKQSDVILDPHWFDQTDDIIAVPELKPRTIQKRSSQFAHKFKRQMDYRGRECEVELVADHTYARYQRYNNRAITGEFHILLRKADEIYATTDWDFDGKPDNVGLKLAHIIIHTNPSTKGYHLGNEQLYGSKLLDAFSLHLNSYCVAVVLVHRQPIDKGPIGMMYRGFPRGRGVGGICTKPLVMSRNGPLKSINTGFVTTLLRNKPMTRGLKIVAVAHEIGHAFGSDHDTDPRCIPDERLGFYIMYPRESKQNLQNTYKFSPCSRRYVDNVLKEKSSCFKHKPWPSCGNGRLEGKEECDCGSFVTCMSEDPCCELPGTARQCKFKIGYQCSPNDGPCCTPYCKFAPANKHYNCSSICYRDTYCNGMSAECPQQIPLPSGYVYSATCTCDGYGNCKIPAFSMLSAYEALKDPTYLSIGLAAIVLILLIITVCCRSKFHRAYRYRYHSMYHRFR